MTNATRYSKAAKKRAGPSLVIETKRAALEAQPKQLAAPGRLIRRLATVVESFYDVGVTRWEVQEKQLSAANGQASLGSYLAATKLVSLTQAEKLIALVRGTLRGEAKLAGQEPAHALIALARATPEPDTAAVDRGLRAWLNQATLRPEVARVTRRGTLTREQVDALLPREG